MTKPGQIAVLVVFLLATCGPLVLFLAGVRPDFDENRERTDFPDLAAGSMLDEATYEQLGLAFTDRLPLRDRAIDWDAGIDERITLTDPVVEDRPRGTDGWLYHHETLLDECPSPHPPSRFVEAGRDAAAATEEAGVPFVFVVAPDKVSVDPSHLPAEGLAGVLGLSTAQDPACTKEWREAIDRAAADEPWLLPALDAVVARSGDPDEPTYFRLDTHWTDHGALGEVEVVIDELAPEFWDPATVVPGAEVTRVGDLTRLVGKPEEETVRGYENVRPGVTVTEERIGSQRPGDDANSYLVTKATSTFASLVEGTTLFIADSFGRRSLDLLAPYFEEMVVVSRSYLLDHSITDVLDHRPDTVVYEMIQRNLAKAWYQTGFDAVVEAMELPPS